MIEGKGYKVIEFCDVDEAISNVKQAAGAVAEYLKQLNGDGQGEQDAQEWLHDVMVLIEAAKATKKALTGGKGLPLISKDVTPERREQIKEEIGAALSAMKGMDKMMEAGI